MMNCELGYHGDVIAFDLDDTLVRERDYCRSGFLYIEEWLKVRSGGKFEGVSAEMTRLLEAREPYFDYLEERLREEGLDSLMAEIVAAYRRHVPASLPPAEGAKELLDELARRGVALAIVTDGRSATQRAKLTAAGLDRYFPPRNIIISEETGHDKSSPDNFRRIVDTYPEARRFFYIGDNPRKDFLIPNLLGWTTCRAPWNNDNVHILTEESDKMKAATINLSEFSSFLNEIQPKGNY